MQSATTQVPDSRVENLTRSVGQRVRAMRSRRGLTRKNLALHSGVSERYLAQLEQGEANISLALLWRVANALGVGMRTLIPADDEEPIKYEPLGQLLRTFSRPLQEHAYQLLSEHFSDRRQTSKGVALIGLRGAGKSTLGELLATRFRVPFVRLNTVISELAGMDMNELISLTGQAQYRRLELQALQETVANHSTAVLETGGSLISEPETYRILCQHYYAVWVRAHPEDHMNRVIAQGDIRPMAGNRQAMEDLKLILEQRKADYQLADAEIMTSGNSVQQSLDELTCLCAPHLETKEQSREIARAHAHD